MQWSIRGLLNPVITRSLIYGVSPFDMEYVLQRMDEKPLINGKVLEQTWSEQWSKKANRYSTYGKAAKEEGNLLSAAEYYMMTARCYYAMYLINSDQIAGKREIYKKLERYYCAAISCMGRRVEKVSIPMGEHKQLPGYLHLPKEEEKSYPCVIVYAGLGSCKEELETMVAPLLARGVAVLALDQPGTGSALFDYDVKLGGAMLEQGFDATMDYLRAHPQIDASRLGTYGLCMGGSFAYRMAAKYNDIVCCANLFPLFVSMLDENTIPRWMKSGTWADYQRIHGGMEFMEDMKAVDEGCVSGEYLIAHSSYDNWMPLEKTNLIKEKTTGKIEEMVIEDSPAYATKETIMHAMPVGEQMHWVKLKVADWFVRKLSKEI